MFSFFNEESEVDSIVICTLLYSDGKYRYIDGSHNYLSGFETRVTSLLQFRTYMYACFQLAAIQPNLVP